MKKKFFSTAIVCYLCVNGLFAGGLLTNTNQSVHFLRNPARGASMEIDAVYTNPAGLAKLSHDGFHFTLNNQSAFQTRTITSTFAPFAGFGGSTTKVFEGDASAPFIPSFMAAYKTNNWVFSGSFAIVGGGGSLTFDQGLPSFEAPISMIPGMFNAATDNMFNITQYSVDMYLKGTSIIYGVQFGATYAINDLFSVFGGARLAFVDNSYEGYLMNIQINPTFAGNPDGNLMSAPVFFNAIGQPTFAAQTADRNLDSQQSGMGVTPIIGFNFNWERLNVGIKYEFNTAITVENDTKVNTTGVADFDDKVKTPHDIPAFLAIGAQYDVLPCLTISAGFHQFFDSNAKMANDKQNYINGGNTEFLLGAEWRINRMFLISAGGQITRTGVTDNYQIDLSYSLNSYSIGLGGVVNVTERIRINAGYFFTVFEDWTKESNAYAGINGMSGTDVFSRTNQVFGIGVDFRF
jgi:long-chain fatty acid transport protein